MARPRHTRRQPGRLTAVRAQAFLAGVQRGQDSRIDGVDHSALKFVRNHSGRV